MSLKSEPSGLSDSPSLREFMISFTFPLNAPTLMKRWLPTTMGRFLSFCFFRASFSLLSRMCFGNFFSTACKASPKHSSHFNLAPPTSNSRASKNATSPEKGGHTTKHWPPSLTSLTCQGETFSGSFPANCSLMAVQLCSAGTPLKETTAPPSCACAVFFLWWCCGFASSLGKAALPGRRTAEPSSLSSSLEPLSAAMTSSLLVRIAFILLQLKMRLISSHPSASPAIFSLKNLSCLRLSSLR
mmetsp:Transcript_65504/g.183155  ORF Transcript_65504/g.183155 Transcript_65504/m.183155 type:complete len:243 (-) Transcript_65504:199-927(-)